MARTNGVYTRPTNSFSNPVSGTAISPTDADTLFDDIETALDVISIRDDKFSIRDNSDPTKIVAFQASGITTGTTRTLTAPDANTTIVGTDATQELTNKTLNAAVGKGTWTASGTWTIPAVTFGGTVTLNGQTLSGAATFDNSITGVTSLTMSSFVDMTEIASPSNPSADHLRLFAKDVASSTHLFTRDSAGTEVDLTAGGGAATAASQAQMEAAADTATFVSPGRTQYHPGVAKGWAFVDTDGVLLAGHNITSSKDSTGVYSLTIGTDMSSANYAIIATSQSGNSNAIANNVAAGSFKVETRITDTNTNADSRFYVVIFGDQA